MTDTVQGGEQQAVFRVKLKRTTTLTTELRIECASEEAAVEQALEIAEGADWLLGDTVLGDASAPEVVDVVRQPR